MFHPRRDHEGRRTVRIDVIGAILRVVLQDKHGGAGPEARFRKSLDNHTDALVVIGGAKGILVAPKGRSAHAAEATHA